MLIEPDMPKLVADMIRGQWDLAMGDEPVIYYDRNSYSAYLRVGGLYIYTVNISVPTISTVDYRTTQRNYYLDIRIMNPNREKNIAWINEVYRILMANRRAGPKKLGGYEFLEVTAVEQINDTTAWYAATISVKFTGYAFPIHSSGFGGKNV